MPRYDVRCEAHGVFETFRHIGQPFACEAAPPRNERRPNRRRRCFAHVEQVFFPDSLPAARIDCAGEDSTHPERRADGSHVYNVALRGVDTVVGARPDGRPALSYRPLTNAEVSSNRNLREIAKRQGLEPIERGSYRTLGKS